jgi:hypothetical protein
MKMMSDEDLEVHSPSSPKLEAAERDVALAQARFSEDLQRVSTTGKRLTKTIMKGARPALVGVAVVTGVALIVAVWRSRRSSPTIRFAAMPRRHSLWLELGRAAVLALASSAGKHLAARVAVGIAEQQAALGATSPYPRPPADS